jgi:hypothetical protein
MFSFVKRWMRLFSYFAAMKRITDFVRKVRFDINAMREPRLYQYAQPWSRSLPLSATSALLGSIPLTNAGDLWTNVPAYSASNSEFSMAGSSRSDSFSSDAGFSAAAAAGGPLAPPTRPGMMRAGSRPQFGRIISYPYGSLGGRGI